MDPAPARYLIRINGHLGTTVLAGNRRCSDSPGQCGWHGYRTVASMIENGVPVGRLAMPA